MSAAVAGGSGLSAVGNLIQGQASKKAADVQADIADQNAAEAEGKARIDEMRERVRSRMVIGSAQAGYGAAGVSAGEGSALEVLSSSAANAEFDALLIKHRGDVESSNFRNEGKMLRYQGGQAEIGSFFGASSSVLLGGAKAQQMATE